MKSAHPATALVRLAIVGMLTVGASACSSVPDWVDPTTWGGSDSTASDQTAAPPADTADASSDTSSDKTADNTDSSASTTNSGAGGQYPDLASIPDRPASPSTSDDRKKVANALVSDRGRAQYSGDALRGGTEAAAPPPPPPSAADAAAQADSSSQSSSDSTLADTESAADSQTSNTSDTDASASTATDTPPAAPTTAVNTTTTSNPIPSAPASDGVPAVPKDATPTISGIRVPVVTDSQLGFKPSNAPALDSSVSQFVPQPIIDRYRQTAVMGAAPGVSSAPPPANIQSNAAGTRRSRAGANDVAMGGPERMSGAVVADFDALQSNSTVPASAYAAGGVQPTAVVFFPHDTTVLNSEGRAQVRAAVEAFKATGGQAYVRVVGHSSSRTANMPLARHLQYNFERSQARANAVARQLIKSGVPASKVLVEAVGDSQPVYYESMPQGEEGNRRAEIFIQS